MKRIQLLIAFVAILSYPLVSYATLSSPWTHYFINGDFKNNYYGEITLSNIRWEYSFDSFASTPSYDTNQEAYKFTVSKNTKASINLSTTDFKDYTITKVSLITGSTTISYSITCSITNDENIVAKSPITVAKSEESLSLYSVPLSGKGNTLTLFWDIRNSTNSNCSLYFQSITVEFVDNEGNHGSVDIINKKNISTGTPYLPDGDYRGFSYSAPSQYLYYTIYKEKAGSNDICFDSSDKNCGFQVITPNNKYIHSLTFKDITTENENLNLNIYGFMDAYDYEFFAPGEKHQSECLLCNIKPSNQETVTFTLPGNYKRISIRPSGKGEICFSELQISFVDEPAAFISDIFDTEKREVKQAFENKQVTMGGYLHVIAVNQPDKIAYAQDTKGQTIRIQADDIEGIEAGIVLRALKFTPSVQNGVFIATISGLLDSEEDFEYTNNHGIDFPEGENISITRQELTSTSDWTVHTFGNAVTYSGKFDEIEVTPAATINYASYYDQVSLFGGKVKFIHDHFGNNTEAIKAMNRHIYLTANPDKINPGETNQYLFEGIIIPIVPSSSMGYSLAPGQYAAQFLVTKASTSGGGAITDVDDIILDNSPVEYYNLQGLKIDTPSHGTLVIRRQNNRVQKVIF